MAYSDEKSYGSARYHGMKVGGVHGWTYPDGQWTERKVKPDRWEVTFTSLKRRNRTAPAGSGAEVGSGYHWLIVAHQWVDKLDANTYATQLEGSKYLVAFRKPDWPVWNTQFRNARRGAKAKTIAALQDMIRRIEESGEDLEDVVDQAALVDLAANFAAGQSGRAAETATATARRKSANGGPGRQRTAPEAETGGTPAKRDKADKAETAEKAEKADKMGKAETTARRKAVRTARSRGARRRQVRPRRRRQAAVSR